MRDLFCLAQKRNGHDYSFFNFFIEFHFQFSFDYKLSSSFFPRHIFFHYYPLNYMIFFISPLHLLLSALRINLYRALPRHPL